VRLYLLIDELSTGRLGWRRREQARLRARLQQAILPYMASSVPDDYLSESYPWCFVMPSPASKKGSRYYAGALMVFRTAQGEKSAAVIYTSVSYGWLKKDLSSAFPVTFWMTRVLNHYVRKNEFSNGSWRSLREWVRALRRAYSPFWESFALTPNFRFKNRSQVLLREGSQEDYRIRDSDGVEIMPWKNWPDCLAGEACIWLWRQSRHRKILDSQRIPLQRAEAEGPDASF